MAKTKDQKASALVATLVTTDVSIDKDDVLSVAVNRAEEHMHEQLRLAEADLALCNEASTKCYRAMCAAANEAADRDYSGAAEDIKFAIAELGIKQLTSSARGSTANINWNGKMPKKYCVVVTVYGDAGHRTLFTHSHLVPIPTGLRAAIREHIKALKKVNDVANDVMSWKRKLGNIPQLERKYRARLAEKRVTSEVGGAELLAFITGDMVKDTLLLPGA